MATATRRINVESPFPVRGPRETGQLCRWRSHEKGSCSVYVVAHCLKDSTHRAFAQLQGHADQQSRECAKLPSCPWHETKDVPERAAEGEGGDS